MCQLPTRNKGKNLKYQFAHFLDIYFWMKSIYEIYSFEKLIDESTCLHKLMQFPIVTVYYIFY